MEDASSIARETADGQEVLLGMLLLAGSQIFGNYQIGFLPTPLMSTFQLALGVPQVNIAAINAV